MTVLNVLHSTKSILYRFSRATVNRLVVQDGKVAFNLVCKAASELNATFSFPILCTLTFKFIDAIINLYLIIYHNMKPDERTARMHSNLVYIFCASVLIILLVTYTAEIPIFAVYFSIIILFTIILISFMFCYIG